MATIKSINQTIDEYVPSVSDVETYVKKTAEEIKKNVIEYDQVQDDRLSSNEANIITMTQSIRALDHENQGVTDPIPDGRVTVLEKKPTIGVYSKLGDLVLDPPKISTDVVDPIALKSYVDEQDELDRERLTVLEDKPVWDAGDDETTILYNDEPLATKGYVDEQDELDRERLSDLESRTDDTEDRIQDLEDNVVYVTGNQTIAGVKTFTDTPRIPEQTGVVPFDLTAEKDRAATPAEIARTFLTSFPREALNDADKHRDEVVNSITPSEIINAYHATTNPTGHPHNGGRIGVFFDVKGRNVIGKTNHENDFAFMSTTLRLNVKKDSDTWSTRKKTDGTGYNGYEEIEFNVPTVTYWPSAQGIRDKTWSNFEIPTALLVQKIYEDLHTNYVRKTPSMDPAKFKYRVQPEKDPVTGDITKWNYSLIGDEIENQEIDESIYGVKHFVSHPVVPSKSTFGAVKSSTQYATEAQIDGLLDGLFEGNRTITGFWNFATGIKAKVIQDSENHNVMSIVNNDHGVVGDVMLIGNYEDIIRFQSKKRGAGNIEIDFGADGVEQIAYVSDVEALEEKLDEEVERLDGEIERLDEKIDTEVERIDEDIQELRDTKIDKSIADVGVPGYSDGYILGDLWVNKSGDDIRMDKFKLNVDDGDVERQSAVIKAAGQLEFSFAGTKDDPIITIDAGKLVPKSHLPKGIISALEFESGSAIMKYESVDANTGVSTPHAVRMIGGKNIDVSYEEDVDVGGGKVENQIIIDGSDSVSLENIPEVGGKRSILLDVRPQWASDKKELPIKFSYADLNEGGVPYDLIGRVVLTHALDFDVAPAKVSIGVNESELVNVLHLNDNGKPGQPEYITALKIFTVPPKVPAKTDLPGSMGFVDEYATERQLMELDRIVVHKTGNLTEKINGEKFFENIVYMNELVDIKADGSRGHDIITVRHQSDNINILTLGNDVDMMHLRTKSDPTDQFSVEGENASEDGLETKDVGHGTHIKVTVDSSGPRRLAYLDEVELLARKAKKLGTWNTHEQYPTAKAVWDRIEEIKTMAMRYDGNVEYFATDTSQITNAVLGDRAIIQTDPGVEQPTMWSLEEPGGGLEWVKVDVEFKNGSVYIVKNIITKQSDPMGGALTQSTPPSGYVVFEVKEGETIGKFHEVEDDFRTPDKKTIFVNGDGNLALAPKYKDTIEDAVQRVDIAVSGNGRTQVVTAMLPHLVGDDLNIEMFSSDVGRETWDDPNSVTTGSALPRHIQETVKISPVGGIEINQGATPAEFELDTSKLILKEAIRKSGVFAGTGEQYRLVMNSLVPTGLTPDRIELTAYFSDVDDPASQSDPVLAPMLNFKIGIDAGYNVKFSAGSGTGDLEIGTDFAWQTPLATDWE